LFGGNDQAGLGSIELSSMTQISFFFGNLPACQLSGRDFFIGIYYLVLNRHPEKLHQ
jgi:hypothetical protein